MLAWGLVSIAAFLMFVAWSIISGPSGPKSVPVDGPSVTLLASLMSGYSIHDFMIQSIIKNPKREAYQGIVSWTFVLGIASYIFMALGSFGKSSITQESLTELQS